MNTATWEKLKRRINNRIQTIKERIDELENSKTDLSVHGYWSLGYYTGVLNQLYSKLDMLEDIYNEEASADDLIIVTIKNDKTGETYFKYFNNEKEYNKWFDKQAGDVNILSVKR